MASEPTPRLRPDRAIARLRRSETGRAAAVGAAIGFGNVVALVFTVVFARLLGAEDYGSLAALLSLFLILSLPGSALQVAVARDLSAAAEHEHAAHEARAAAAVRHAVALTLAAALAGALLRHQLADATGVSEEWAAALAPPAGALWLLVSIQRGVLQGFRQYRLLSLSFVVDALLRFGFAGLLYALGLGVAGIFGALALSIATVALWLERTVHGDLAGTRAGGAGGLGSLARAAWAPALALGLLALLQNVDVIVANHRLGEQAAGEYAAASITAKGIVWIAVGLGVYLLPESARRAERRAEARGVLVRVLGLVGAVGLPLLGLYLVAGAWLLRLIFGGEYGGAAEALPWLGAGMTLLAISYLLAQHLLGVGRLAFLWPLALAAAAQPALLGSVGGGVVRFAIVLAALQLALAAAHTVAELWPERRPAPSG